MQPDVRVVAGPRYRIAHVITRLELGGAQQNTLYCTRHHDRERFEVDLVAGRGGLLDDEALSIEDAGVRLLPSLRHAIAPVWDPVALFRLRSYFKARRVDLVHTHSSKAGILGRLAAVLAGVPAVVHTVHGWSFNRTQPARLRRVYVGLERLAATWTDRMIAVSADNRREGLALGIGREEQYSVVRSGIELDGLGPSGTARETLRRSLGYGPDEIVVGALACLKPQKAPLDFVRAAAAAHARDPRLRFFIAGDGELRSAAEALIRELGLEGIVQLLGWRRDVADLLRVMDLFLLTSLFEGLPRAVLQAMAAGTPVVATAVDGTPEVVEHRRTGLLVPPSRPESAAEAMLELAGDELLRRRCVAEARRRVGSEFDIRRMVSELERTYLSLLEGR